MLSESSHVIVHRELSQGSARRMAHSRLAEAFGDWRAEAGACAVLRRSGEQAHRLIASARLAHMFQHWAVGPHNLH